MHKYQQTLGGEYTFTGKGLHTGLNATMTLKPSEVNTGIRFLRTDIGNNAFIEANVDNVTHTNRSTTLEHNGAKVITIEHVLAALWGLGVDNAIVEIDGVEVPIMDGSAYHFAKAIISDPLVSQEAEKVIYSLDEEIHYKDEETGAEVLIQPSDDFSIDLTTDYGSKVLGVQKYYFDTKSDFYKELAPCRTFVFFHELEFLFKNNLIKGGDVENAIVIVENDVPQETLDEMAALFNVQKLEKVSAGYLNNLSLHFEDECVRHKLLDVIGDFTLVGFRFFGKIIAAKTGHKINTEVARIIRQHAIKIK